MNESVIIIGAGISGLAAALRLQTQGYHVCVLEKNNYPGGRLYRICRDGYCFDIGPTFFSMSYEFKRFARECNMKLPFEFQPVDPLYSVNLGENGTTFHVYRDIDLLTNQFEQFEPAFKDKMYNYLRHSGTLFHDTIDCVVQQNFNSLSDYLKKLLRVPIKHIPVLLRNVQQEIARYFDSAEAQLVFSLFSYFLGASPKQVNGIYTLLSYTEFIHDGYHRIQGGMYSIIESLVKELTTRNIPIIYNTEIRQSKFQGRRIIGLTDTDGKLYQADYYISNMDGIMFRQRILNKSQYTETKLSKMKWSMGFFCLCIGTDCKIPFPALHNYYIGKNLYRYNKAFQLKELPDNPYFYVNVSPYDNSASAPAGNEALFVVVPVPNLLYIKDWSHKNQVAEEIIIELEKRINFPIRSHIRSLIIITPEDWAEKFNLYAGAGLGLTQSMSQTGYLRSKNYDEDFDNLFYTGASTVPGIGLPMGIISSRLTVERLSAQREKDVGIIRRLSNYSSNEVDNIY